MHVIGQSIIRIPFDVFECSFFIFFVWRVLQARSTMLSSVFAYPLALLVAINSVVFRLSCQANGKRDRINRKCVTRCAEVLANMPTVRSFDREQAEYRRFSAAKGLVQRLEQENYLRSEWAGWVCHLVNMFLLCRGRAKVGLKHAGPFPPTRVGVILYECQCLSWPLIYPRKLESLASRLARPCA